MAVHLKKLSVGAVSIDSLKSWQDRLTKAGKPILHPTRNWPRRAEELLDGGCIYWIIKGQMLARQPIADLVEITRADGRAACGIVLHPPLIPVWPRRHRIFQGWRYLEAADAPEDLPQDMSSQTAMPADMAAELRELGLL